MPYNIRSRLVAFGISHTTDGYPTTSQEVLVSTNPPAPPNDLGESRYRKEIINTEGVVPLNF